MATSDAYGNVRAGRLKLKGNKSIFKASKLKQKKKVTHSKEKDEATADSMVHGGWRKIFEENELTGGMNIVLEADSNPSCYVASLDNGRFTLGNAHMAGEGPSPEEVLTLIKTPDDFNISLKTGFGKYVGVDSEGNLVAVADAIGNRERLIFVFQDGKSALSSTFSNMFLSLKPGKDGLLHVVSRKVEEDETISLRTDAEKIGPTDWRSTDDMKPAKECEQTYVKIYQHSKVDMKGKNIPINVDEKQSVKRAQVQGNLHETLLERRIKTKSDKYC